MNRINLSLLGLLLLLASCGGGNSGSITPAPVVGDDPVSGIGRTGFAMGPITTFGSVVVNGVRFDTSDATFTVNGEAATEGDLKVGQVVIVRGTIDDDRTSGTASSVHFDSEVTGPVESIDIPSRQLTVMGQTVIVDDSTSFDDSIIPASIDGLSIGDIVEVSGLINADGAIAATRIELKTAGTEFEVEGPVSQHDADARTFNIRGLVVDYSSAQLEGFANGSVSDGDYVEAEGTAFGASGEFLANSVEKEDSPGAGEDGDAVELEGFVTRFTSATDFDVAGFPVTTNSSTLFEDGSADDLGLNIKVEIEGHLDANGVIVASTVEIRRASTARVAALIDSVDANDGSLVMLGITVNVDAGTRLEDKTDANLRPLTLADLAAGDYVAVRGDEFPANSGEVRARLLERDEVETDTELRGFVTALTEPTLTVLGVTIETNTETVFRDENDLVISAAEFFNRVAVGSMVDADGTETAAAVLLATEVELELP